MKVCRGGASTPEMREKILFNAEVFVTNLSEYFLPRNYGKGVNEILYREFCLKDGYEGKLLHYGKIRKIIDCAVVSDHGTSVRMTRDEYLNELSKKYMIITSRFSELKVKDFDLDAYLADLKAFFQGHDLLK